MIITKLEHSGIAIEKDGKTIVFDPVEFDTKLPTFQDVVAIIITHKHSDHLQPDKITSILQTNPDAKILTVGDTADMLPQATVVQPGDILDVENFKLEFFGKDHASIIAGQVPCENIGVIVDDKIVNPGDSFDLPAIQAKVLCAPLSAPWCKISEVIDFIKKAQPKIIIPIHDAVLSGLGREFNNNWLRATCDDINADFYPLRHGESLSIN